MGNHDGCHGPTTVYLPRFTIEINQMMGKIQALWDDLFFLFPYMYGIFFHCMDGWIFVGFHLGISYIGSTFGLFLPFFMEN